MAISGVYGLGRFSEYMKGLEDCYAIIGGTACDIVLSNADLDFRATKDIDVILLVENRFPEVAAAVWGLVKDGGYDCGWKSSEGVHSIVSQGRVSRVFRAWWSCSAKLLRLSRSQMG